MCAEQSAPAGGSGDGVSVHRIGLVGCDDTTVLEVDLTAHEVRVVERLCALSATVAQRDCQPTMRLDHPDDRDEDVAW
jgi:hypothetical protein